MTDWKQHAVSTGRRIVIEAPARLHLGFLDLNGDFGRQFGSLGLTIDAFPARLSVEKANDFAASGPDMERATRCARSILATLKLPGAVRIRVDSSIPAHIGLGSGTQMSLGIGAAIAQLYEVDLDTRDIAGILERGARSGIGIGAFDHGGFLIDGGLGQCGKPPPLIARHPFPTDWRVILIFDSHDQGLHGEQEMRAFEQLPKFPEERAANLCRLALMRVLPGLLEQDIDAFGRGIGELQETVGDHFAPAQGGRFSSAAVSEALRWFTAQGLRGVGQSSWGPTGFALVDSEEHANALLSQARARFGELSQLRFKVVNARNKGSTVESQVQLRKDLAGEA